MKVYATDLSQVGSNTYRMVLYGNGTSSEAVTAGFISDGKFEGKVIAQGSAYVNTKTVGVELWDEENKKFGA